MKIVKWWIGKTQKWLGNKLYKDNESKNEENDQKWDNGGGKLGKKQFIAID